MVAKFNHNRLSMPNKITRPRPPEQDKYIFSEGINYLETGKTSIWGTGDKETLELLRKIRIRGRWLNLAAGDGRYNQQLLKKADYVVASDVDENALSKLWQTTPEKYRTKLEIKAFDLTNRFPFENNYFDGVFCTGILHIFPRKILEDIIEEADRVLKPDGKIIENFE